MSDINCIPDENGVRLCNEECDCYMARRHYPKKGNCSEIEGPVDPGDICYPGTAKQAAALAGIKDWWKDGEVSDEDLCFQQVYIVITKALEVLSP